MDPLTDLLRPVRASGAVLRRSLVSPPWAWTNDTAPPLTLYVVVRGRAWVVPADGEAVELSAGDTAIVRGVRPHRVADSPSTPSQVVIDRALHCTPARAGAPAAGEVPRLGPRTYGHDDRAPFVLVTGAYQIASEVGQRLLDALPPVLTVPAPEKGPSTAHVLLTEELDVDQPGQQVVLDRLLDLVLVRTLRGWFARPDADPPAWYRALGDPVAGAALRALHRDPGRRWTVASLAATSGVSRAALARRFTALVGQPPLTYLTRWRLTVAADLLRERGVTVASVARRVGYSNPYAFSTAFRRLHGVSPSQARTARAGDRPARHRPGGTHDPA